MKSKYKRVGQYIRQVDVRNTEGKEENLLGVSVQKKFIPSIANTVGTDFTKYKVVKKGQFTYIPDTSRRGDKIGIALLEDYEEGLVSNVYTVFEVIDEKQLIPQYLMLWFSRPEFDRFARFKSHGSVREVMDWDEMCNVELPVPTYEEQIRIVESYKTITDIIFTAPILKALLAIKVLINIAPISMHRFAATFADIHIAALCAAYRTVVLLFSAAADTSSHGTNRHFAIVCFPFQQGHNRISILIVRIVVAVHRRFTVGFGFFSALD